MAEVAYGWVRGGVVGWLSGSATNFIWVFFYVGIDEKGELDGGRRCKDAGSLVDQINTIS